MAGALQRLVRGAPDGLTQEERIKQRVLRAERPPKALPGVTRLNEGFFRLEHRRAGPKVKARGK
jgi:hypothetical protein